MERVPGPRVPTVVRRSLREHHADVLDAVDACADAVAETWEGPSTADRVHVVPPFERLVQESGVLGRLPDLLAGSVAATGRELEATPVAAPPYVVVTSRGPVLRATLGDGRLVVTIGVFEVTRDPSVRYRRGTPAAGDALAVAFETR